MGIKTNDVYTKAVYSLLARINNGEIDNAAEYYNETERLADFLAVGRFWYTAHYLRLISEKAQERWDPEAIKASLLTILHDRNEMKLRRELQARGWKHL